MAFTRPRPLRLDGRFFRRGGRRVFIKAVTYGPFPPDQTPDDDEELARIAAAGFNTLRLYTAPDRHFLDLAAKHDLMVMVGLHWQWTENFLQDSRIRSTAAMTFTRFLEEHGHHPALAAIFVGNEIPPDLVRWLGPSEVRDTIEHLIDVCHDVAPHILIAYANFPTTEYLEPRNADFTAFNVYLEEREPLRSYLQRLHNIAGDRPVLLTEFGLDTVRHSETEQVEILRWHLLECLEAGVAGTTFFAWSDLWVAGDRTVTDWAFGLTRADGSAKPVLRTLQSTLPALEEPRDALSCKVFCKVSVVICTHNGASRLSDCLSACLSIDYPDYEVIVVDDGSTDQTRAVTETFSGVRYIHQKHGGLSVARNRGAEAATGDIIAYTDDDCEPDRDWLFWVVRCFEDPKVGAAGGPNLPPTPGGLQEAVIAAGPGAPSHVLLTDTRAEHLPGCNLVLRREAFKAVRGFREQYMTAGDDVDLCWRLIDDGWSLAFAPAAFVWHRRRTSFLRYLKQQAGYGRAEALLYEDHSDRFGSNGFRWQGAIYAGGPISADENAVIYHGSLGNAPFQSVASPVMPRRRIHRRFDSNTARLLLAIAEWAVPRIRGWSRLRHGGPAPRYISTRSHTKVYRDDLRSSTELAFPTSDFGCRTTFLQHLRTIGWHPGSDTDQWDLEKRPYVLAAVFEQHGSESGTLRIRFLHPPGLKQTILTELNGAALDIGLDLSS